MTRTIETSDSESQVIISSAASSTDEPASLNSSCNKQKKAKCKKQVEHGERFTCKNKKTKAQAKSKLKNAKGQKAREKRAKRSESSESETGSVLASENASEPSSEAETTEEEASSAAETSTENKEDSSPAKNAETEASTWSISEDAILCSMRRGGESWAEIAESLGRRKADLKARLKVLVKEAGVERAKQVQVKEREKKRAIDKKNKNREKGKKKRKVVKKNSPSEESEDTWEEDEEEDDAQASQESDTESSPELSEATADPASQSDEGSEYRLQQVYLNKCIRAELYPQRINLKPDDALTLVDCEILASIDAERHQTRWLAVQANFYNMTGRMLPLEVIRKRCEAAEWEAMRQRLDAQGDGHLAEKVQSWIRGVYA